MAQDQSNFDEQAYLAAYPDVAAAIGQPNVESGYAHYLNYGQNEGRQGFFNEEQAQEPTDYKQLANTLGEDIYTAYGLNRNYDQEYKQLQEIKNIDPAAYYENQLEFLGRQAGWQIGQNTNYRNEPVYAQINSLIPEAQKAGLSPEKINSLVGSSINQANMENQQRIVNEQQAGNFYTESLLGAGKIAALAAGAYGLDAALAAGYAGSGAAGAGAIDSTAVALGGSGGGGAFIPAAGSGASFALPGVASYAPLTTAELLSSSGFTPTAGSSFGIDPTAAYTAASTGAPVYDYSQPFSFEQMGPTYQELGVTGVEGGMAGPTYGELGYTGLNQAEAIAAADAASKGLTGAEALKYINNAKKALDTAGKLSKILSPSTGQSATGGSNSLDLGKLASMLNAPQQANSFIGQIKGNQNPFLFNVPGQTVASEGMYDVSGSNFAKANALRNYKA